MDSISKSVSKAGQSLRRSVAGAQKSASQRPYMAALMVAMVLVVIWVAMPHLPYQVMHYLVNPFYAFGAAYVVMYAFRFDVKTSLVAAAAFALFMRFGYPFWWAAQMEKVAEDAADMVEDVVDDVDDYLFPRPPGHSEGAGDASPADHDVMSHPIHGMHSGAADMQMTPLH